MNQREARVLKYMLATGLASFAAISGFVILNRGNPAVMSFALVGVMQLFGGTLVGVSGGAATTPPLWALVLGSFVPGMITLLVAYPLFHLFYDEVSGSTLLGPFVERLERAVETNGSLVRRFEHVGIFLFCFAPVQMTGSVASACIARVLGFRMRETFAVVVPAAFLAAVFWALVARGVVGGAMVLVSGGNTAAAVAAAAALVAATVAVAKRETILARLARE